jgi:type VI secretion system secreted protein Hcp
MALNSFLVLKGQRQGLIRGSVVQRGREDSIKVTAAEHEIVSPRDPATGLPSGKRIHRPMVITKELDKATPLLYAALAQNEKFTEWTLRYWRPVSTATSTGSEEQYFTVNLANASISSIKAVTPNTAVQETAGLQSYEVVTFTYERITWTWTNGGLTSADSWNATV